MIGSQIGSFRFIEKIGEGGMGVVYRGIDTELDRQVAIKVLLPELASDGELVERFRAEAKAQANLNHINIATLFAFMRAEAQCLIVMEFIEGKTFERLISDRGKIPWRGAASLTKQVLQGLGFAHSRGVVHRDIKPANLMLTNGGIVKIMDFGIVKAMSGRTKTRTGLQMGTPRYMSPEQIRGVQVDPRSDIYSLGVTFYELLTGDAPFKSDSDFDLMRKHVDTPPPRFTTFHADIPVSVEAVAMKALAKDPAERFQTADEFTAALENATGPSPHQAPDHHVADHPVPDIGKQAASYTPVPSIPPQRFDSQRIEAQRIEPQRIEPQRIEAQRIEAQKTAPPRIEFRTAPPVSNVAAPAYPNPPNMPWLAVLWVAMITAGIFGWIWAFVEAAWVRKVDPRSNATVLLWFAVILNYGGLIATVVAAQTDGPPAVLLIPLAGNIFALVAAFKMRRSIQQHYNSAEPLGLKLSGVMTFFFSFLYLQYHFNHIVRMKERGGVALSGDRK